VEHNQDKVTKGEGVIAPSPGLHNNTSREGNDARRCRRCWPSRKTGITPEDLGTRWSRRGGPALAASGDAPPPRTHSRQRWRSPRASQRQPRVTRRGHPTSECKATTSRLEKGNPHPRERRSGPGSAGVGAWWSGASGRQWADPPPAGNQHTQDRGISKESADPGPGPGPGPGTVDLKPDGRTPTNGGEPRRPRVGERVEW
jgi:hypothetical protein